MNAPNKLINFNNSAGFSNRNNCKTDESLFENNKRKDSLN